MSEHDQGQPPILSNEGEQWIIVFVDVHSAERESEAIGPFETRTRVQTYADLTNTHGSIQPVAQLLRGDEPNLTAPDPEVLAKVDARLAARERLNQVGDNAYPRIHPSEHGYRVVFGFGEEIVEYAVTEEGEHMRLPRSERGIVTNSSSDPAELPPAAREKVLGLTEEFAAQQVGPSPEL
jgi:hypothetical protein